MELNQLREEEELNIRENEVFNISFFFNKNKNLLF